MEKKKNLMWSLSLTTIGITSIILNGSQEKCENYYVNKKTSTKMSSEEFPQFKLFKPVQHAYLKD